MSNTKTVMSQAANTLAKPLNVEDVFSTYLYEGNGSTQTITNGIDLDGEGGLVWFKSRPQGNHNLMDTERGNTKYIRSNTTDVEGTNTNYITSFNSNGFTLGPSGTLNGTQDYASWTFRKAPKFFDVVTYTGDGVAGRTVSHNLGTTVGSIFIKELTQSDYRWMVYHRSLGNGGLLRLDAVDAATYNNTSFNSTDPTSDLFTLGDSAYVNGSGKEYVAYLFAHNDGDGGFNGGDIIKCGTIDGNQTVDLGFEPQWVMIKRYDAAGNWYMLDTMRGMPVGSDNANMYANRTNAESAGGEVVRILPNGLQSVVSANHIYIAIRRGTKAPESATEVFAATNMSSSTLADTGFAVDLSIDSSRTSSSSNFVNDRLRGSGVYMNTDGTTAEQTGGSRHFDSNQGVIYTSGFTGINWSWKRAPGFFDVVAYTGDGTYPRDISHNLGVAPEMVIIKARNWSSGNWATHHKDLGFSKVSYLDNTLGSANQIRVLTASDPSTFTVGDATSFSNYSNSASYNYIAYLFASLDGVSKVGSFTGNGTSQDIDCGFTSGARFVLLKRTDSSGTWFILDTERGIVAGNDAILRPNTTTAEDNSYDIIDPLSSGFTINYVSAYNMNASGATYIFYAIA